MPDGSLGDWSISSAFRLIALVGEGLKKLSMTLVGECLGCKMLTTGAVFSFDASAAVFGAIFSLFFLTLFLAFNCISERAAFESSMGFIAAVNSV